MVCVGLTCTWAPNDVQYARDLTPVMLGSAVGIAHPPTSSCRATVYQRGSNCRGILVPTRESFYNCSRVGTGARCGFHGWGSRVNGMVSAVPFALAQGYAFQMSQHACAAEDAAEQRDGEARNPHCFFQPFSLGCGSDDSPIVHIDSQSEGHKKTYLIASQVKDACLALTEAAGFKAKCTASQLDAWRGIARVVLQPQPDIAVATKAIVSQMMQGKDASTYAAMHVRRGDKVKGSIREMSLQHSCKYVDALRKLSGERGAKDLSVFIASDEVAVTSTEVMGCLRSRNLSWKLLYSDSEPSRHFTRQDNYRLWAEVMILRRARWVAGTFSSNIDRLVQMLRSQPANTMASVDGRGWSITV